MGDRVVHFEIGARDPAPLHRFYAELFGWRVAEVPGAGYALVDTQGGGGVNGGIGTSREGSAWATFYVAVEDPQAALDRAGSLGGRTVVPVTTVPGTITRLRTTTRGAIRITSTYTRGKATPAITATAGAGATRTVSISSPRTGRSSPSSSASASPAASSPTRAPSRSCWRRSRVDG